MTTKADFTDDEWKVLVEGPMTAGMILVTSEGGGTFRETFALAKAYNEARAQHGQSELLDALAASKPEFDRHRYKTTEELHDAGLTQVGAAASLLREKAPEELAAYRAFVLAVASRVAEAHKENGTPVSPAEQTAIDAVAEQLRD